MKNYVKPTLDLATVASSSPIATRSCAGDNYSDDYDYIKTEIVKDGKTYVNDYYANGST